MTTFRVLVVPAILILVSLAAPVGRAGTTGCCLPDGSCQDVTLPTCEEADGLAFGPCSSCAQFNCPPGACITSTEPCHLPHASPGCDYLLCCHLVCSQRPACCTEGWTQECVVLNQSCFESQVGRDGCVGDGSCQTFPLPGACYDAGCTPNPAQPGPGITCDGDADDDGIDDACGCPPQPAPAPVPPTMVAGKNARQAGQIDVIYDATTCGASEHMLLFGPLGSYGQATAAACGIGASGSHTAAPPAGDVWFLVAGREVSRYSSVGQATSGERSPSGVSALCGTGMAQDTSASCP